MAVVVMNGGFVQPPKVSLTAEDEERIHSLFFDVGKFSFLSEMDHFREKSGASSPVVTKLSNVFSDVYEKSMTEFFELSRLDSRFRHRKTIALKKAPSFGQ